MKGSMLSKINPNLPQPITDITETIAQITTGLTRQYGNPSLARLGEFSQRIIAEGLLSALRIELETIKEEGKVKDGYLSSLQAQYTLTELLTFLDNEIPDKKKFEVLKNILLVASTEEKSSRDDIRPQQYMKIIKALPSGAILIMTACYKLITDGFSSNQHGQIETDQWRNMIAERTGLGNYELVCNYEEILEKNRLINSPAGTQKVFVIVNPYFRLTNLGYKIMDYANSLNSKSK